MTPEQMSEAARKASEAAFATPEARMKQAFNVGMANLRRGIKSKEAKIEDLLGYRPKADELSRMAA